jgi:ribonuclease VapC
VTEAVLDASALLAFLLGEPGADKVADVLTSCCISAVNLTETFGKLVEYGKPLDEVSHQVARLRIPVVPYDAVHAEIAASIWMATRAHGLSLGDRACLAVAKERSLPALTAERDWKKCKLGIEIVTVR